MNETQTDTNSMAMERSLSDDILANFDKLPVIEPNFNDRDIVLASGLTLEQDKQAYELAMKELTSLRASKTTQAMTSQFSAPSGNVAVAPVVVSESSVNLQPDNLISAGYSTAKFLVSPFEVPKSEEPDGSPAQTKIAYGFGSKNYLTRRVPSPPRKDKPESPQKEGCTHKIFGLDCSGFIANLALSMGIKGLDAIGSVDMLDPKNWNSKIPTTYNIQAIKIDKPQNDQITHGDIVGWKSKTHIGFVANIKGEKIVFQSNGASEKIPSTGAAKPDNCEKNMSGKRGPRIVNLDTITNASQGWMGPIDTLIRFVGAPKIMEIYPEVGNAKSGLPVEIIGQGFSPKSEVFFGDQSAVKVTYKSPYRLSAIPSSNAKVGPLVVKVTTPSEIGIQTSQESNTVFVNQPNPTHSHRWFDGYWEMKLHCDDDPNSPDYNRYWMRSFTISGSVVVKGTILNQCVNNGQNPLETTELYDESSMSGDNTTRSIGQSSYKDAEGYLNVWVFRVKNDTQAELEWMRAVHKNTFSLGPVLKFVWQKTGADQANVRSLSPADPDYNGGKPLYPDSQIFPFVRVQKN